MEQIALQHMTDAQACLLAQALYKWADERIHKDAYEDEFVGNLMSDLCRVADGLETALEVSDDYSDHSLIEEARDYYCGNVERARGRTANG